MRRLTLRLERPTGHYLPLMEAHLTALKKTDAASVFVRQASPFDKKLERSGLRPSARWYGSKKAFILPPRKPTITASPSAKGKAVVSFSKGGGIGRASHEDVFAVAWSAPHRFSKPAPIMILYRKPEWT